MTWIDVTHNLVDMGPKHRHKIQRGTDRVDWETVAYQSLLNPNRIDPLGYLLHLDYWDRRGYLAKDWCGLCGTWDRTRIYWATKRPPGASERGGCNGCMLSYLDKQRVASEMQRLRDQRDEAREQWIDAQEGLKDLKARRRYQKTKQERAKFIRDKESAHKRLEEAAAACKVLGFDPKITWARRVRRAGDEHDGPVTRTEARIMPKTR